MRFSSRPADNTDDERYSPGERYARVYEINFMRCIFCGYCEDACPTEAIVLGDNYELSFTDRRSAIYGKELLLEPVSGRRQTHPAKGRAGRIHPLGAGDEGPGGLSMLVSCKMPSG